MSELADRLEAACERIANREDLVEDDAALLIDLRAALRAQKPSKPVPEFAEYLIHDMSFTAPEFQVEKMIARLEDWLAAPAGAQKPSEPVGGRAETGPVRFGDDWAGVFIRGDEAFSRALQMDAVAEHYEGLADGISPLAINIRGFGDLLRSCTEPCEARAIPLAPTEEADE